MAHLLLRNVKKSYGIVQVLHGVNIEISMGELIVIVGASGCGKSTLLRLVAGLEELSEGEIELNGHNINKLPPKDRDIAMVFQNYALYPHMTVYNNLAYGLKNRRMDSKEIAFRIDKTAKMLDLERLLDRKPKQLSGGQRQRVAMGRAIVRDPQVFLFDEPLSNLDAKLRGQVRVGIKKLQQELGITSLYVTHDQTEAMTLADRLMVMNAGVVEQIGTPHEVYHHPRTAYVAGFMGNPSMNFFSAEWLVEQKKVCLNNQIVLPVGAALLRHSQSTNILVGIRPEHFYIRQEVLPGTMDVFYMQVDLVEACGPDTYVYGTSQGSKKQMTVRLDGQADVKINDVVPLSVKPEHLHYFDKDSGYRIE